jgi:glutamate/tyrosine decarboxylase-like PLP-dependent enzyme
MAFVRDRESLEAAMTPPVVYLPQGTFREPWKYTPEASRRSRGVEIWAVLRSLGRSGIAEMIERTCGHAARFADGLRNAGYLVLNQVVLNQVLVSFGSDDKTRRVLKAVQDDGTCWCSTASWRGQAAMRISVSSWATTDDDVEKSLSAILRAAREC